MTNQSSSFIYFCNFSIKKSNPMSAFATQYSIDTQKLKSYDNNHAGGSP